MCHAKICIMHAMPTPRTQHCYYKVCGGWTECYRRGSLSVLQHGSLFSNLNVNNTDNIKKLKLTSYCYSAIILVNFDSSS